jgi:hypothetical protein
MQVGSKLKGYLQKFREALGDVPAVRKLAAFMDFTISQEPTADSFDDLLVEDRTNYDSRKQSITALKVQLTLSRPATNGTTTCRKSTNTSRKIPMTMRPGSNSATSTLNGLNTSEPSSASKKLCFYALTTTTTSSAWPSCTTLTEASPTWPQPPNTSPT